MAGLEGRTLDRYELRQMMGRGGMADVYVAYDSRFDRDVAVKVFKREDEDLLRRFIREAQLMASLNNPHLVPVYDAGMTRLDSMNVYYIVMPLMEGGTLRGLIKRAPLSSKDACRYLRDIADALDYIHRQGIIHRDIKASNVLLDADGRAYLSDFGIARTEGPESSQMTNTGNVLGTVDYMAPELFDGDHKANVSTDLYALGVLLYEMVTGTVPFTAQSQIAVITMHVNKLPPSPRQFAPALTPQAERVILKALEKRPERRYSSAGELAEAFCSAIVARPGQTNPLWGQQPTAATMRREEPILLPTPAPAPAMPMASTTGRYTAAPVSQQLNRVDYPYQGTGVVPSRTSSTVRKQTVIVTILALIALLVVLVPVIYVLATHTPGTTPDITPVSTVSNGATSNLTATAQAQAGGTAAAATQQAQKATGTAVSGATATAQATQQAQKATATAVAGATATVVANQTATAVANATATASVPQNATSGNPTYADPLLNPADAPTKDAQWDQSSNCAFQSDGYHVMVNSGVLGSNALKACHEAGRSFTNFAAEVDMTSKSGHSGGIFFRATADALGGFAGYLFEIDSTGGKYKISSSGNYNGTTVNALQDWTASSAITQGKNTLLVIAHGDGSMLFYVNGSYLTTVTDGSYTNGTIGFLASANSGQNADVVYTNLKVYAAS